MNINFTDLVHTRRVHKELLNQVSIEAICFCKKYPIQIEPLCFEWNMFVPKLEKGFPDILNKMLSNNSQWQSLNSNENKSILLRNREPYNNY